MPTGVHDVDDAQQTRDRMFSAVRSLVEAVSRQHPVVIALEDIHWADEGMLDLIEYLARWVRGPAADRLPGSRRAARPPPGLGRRAAKRDHDLARAADPGRDARAGRRAASRRERQRTNGQRGLVPQVAERSARQPAVRRGDGQPDPRGGVGATSRRCPTPCTPCSRPVSTRCPRRSGASSSTPRWSGRPSGRARSPGSRQEEGIDLAGRARRASGEGPGGADRRQPPRRASTSTPSSTC